VLGIDALEELHRPADLAVNCTSVQHVNVLGSLAVGVAIAEVVDVSVGLGRVLVLDEAAQLLVEVGDVRCSVVRIELEHAARRVRKEE